MWRRTRYKWSVTKVEGGPKHCITLSFTLRKKIYNEQMFNLIQSEVAVGSPELTSLVWRNFKRPASC